MLDISPFFIIIQRFRCCWALFSSENDRECLLVWVDFKIWYEERQDWDEDDINSCDVGQGVIKREERGAYKYEKVQNISERL